MSDFVLPIIHDSRQMPAVPQDVLDAAIKLDEWFHQALGHGNPCWELGNVCSRNHARLLTQRDARIAELERDRNAYRQDYKQAFKELNDMRAECDAQRTLAARWRKVAEMFRVRVRHDWYCNANVSTAIQCNCSLKGPLDSYTQLLKEQG